MELSNNIAKTLKNDFPIFRHNLGLVYLDNAATSQKPSSVINAVKEFSERDNANVGRGVYSLAARAMKKYEQARKAVANFLDALPEEIVFTKNTTESLNLLSYTLPSIIPKEKNEILLTEMEHHSNLVPWQQLAKRLGFKLRFVKITKDFLLDMNDLNEKLTDKTAVFAFTHVSNVLGTINDVRLLTKLARSKGVITVIDAAQATHLPINVKEIGCDFLAFSSHKMLGPNGIGVLYGRKELLEKMQPFNFGGGMVETVDFNSATWTKVPEKFEAGTQNIAGAIGLAEATNYIKKIGLENIAEWEDYLLKYALKRLSEVKDITIYNKSPKDRTSIISFNIKGIHPHDVSELLNEKKIAIRAGHMCAMPLMSALKARGGVCRASFSFYNTLEDVDALIDSLKEIQEKFK